MFEEPFYQLKFDVNDVGAPVDLKYFHTGSQDILALATSQGLIVGVDTRCSTPIFRFKNDLNHRKDSFTTVIDHFYSLSFRINHCIGSR